MMAYSTSIHHTTGTDNNARLFGEIEPLGSIYLAYILKAIKSKWIIVFQEIFIEGSVEALRM